MIFSRIFPAAALALLLSAPVQAQPAPSTLSIMTCSLNGRVHANRKFWERLKRQEDESVRNSPAVTVEQYPRAPQPPDDSAAQDRPALQDKEPIDRDQD